MLKTALFTKDVQELTADALVLGFFEGVALPDVERYHSLFDGLLSEVIRSGEFTGKSGKHILIRCKGKIKRLYLVGLGNKEKFSLETVRETVGKAAQTLREAGVKHFALQFFDHLDPYETAAATVEALHLALYTFTEYKSNQEEAQIIDQVTFVGHREYFRSYDRGIKRGLIVSEAVNYVRDLQNKPCNVVTPEYLAAEAIKLAKKFKLKCTVLEKKDMEKLGMGGLLAVSRGSSHAPKFIVLEYFGGKETMCFVGKGITFDTGGISLKPAKDMDEMKFDMSGGASVLGIMQVATRFQFPYHLVGIIPTTDNVPGSKSYKPGEIIRFSNGKTAEVVDTDAEGRLILADALVYTKRFKPSIVVDLATLTGACVVSLGDGCSGLFSTDDELTKRFTAAGEKTGEYVWHLPLFDHYKSYIKSTVADLKNAGPRDAGSITAALFLKEFVECKRWVHLDIAGTAWTKAGGTGVGVRLITQLLEDWK